MWLNNRRRGKKKEGKKDSNPAASSPIRHLLGFDPGSLKVSSRRTDNQLISLLFFPHHGKGCRGLVARCSSRQQSAKQSERDEAQAKKKKKKINKCESPASAVYGKRVMYSRDHTYRSYL